MNIVVDIIVSVGLYKPLGIAGLVIGTVAANAVMTALQLHRLRIGFNGRLEGGQTTMITARIAVASVAAGGRLLGRLVRAATPLLGQSLLGADRQRRRRGRGGRVVYTRAVLAMHIPEAHQVSRLIRARSARVARRTRAPHGARPSRGRVSRGPPGLRPNIDRRLLLTSQDCVSCLGGVTLSTPGQAAGPKTGA